VIEPVGIFFHYGTPRIDGLREHDNVRFPCRHYPTCSELFAKSQNPKSVTPKKGSAKSNATSRRKIPSTAANAKKPLRSAARR
jgi:hypothetical protein